MSGALGSMAMAHFLSAVHASLPMRQACKGTCVASMLHGVLMRMLSGKDNAR